MCSFTRGLEDFSWDDCYGGSGVLRSAVCYICTLCG